MLLEPVLVRCLGEVLDLGVKAGTAVVLELLLLAQLVLTVTAQLTGCSADALGEGDDYVGEY